MIKTQRLTIRRAAADDWKALQRIWLDQKASPLACFDIPRDTEDTAVERRIGMWASFAGGIEHIFFVVCLQDEVIGFLSLNRREEHVWELGYGFRTGQQGKGYARESISGVLPRMRSIGAHTLTAGTALENTPSVRLLTSLGFRQTGTEKVSFYQDGEGRDIVFDGGVFELSMGTEEDEQKEMTGSEERT